MTEITANLNPDIVAGKPILPRDGIITEDFVRGSEIPEDLDPFGKLSDDPLSDGILMKHQVDWLDDRSDLKIAEKGRRTGITFAEALDGTLIAAASREAGGDNVFYIGDSKPKGREFIGYVAHFAKTIQSQLVDIEDGFFDDYDPETGKTRKISSYIARFDSGYRVEALSSRPENIRGLQGVVVIDEAAFHNDVREVIDAVAALLIWEGKVRVISTHNGVLNPFNELINEAKADRLKGKNDTWSIHHIPFQAAVDNGLYKRVCYVKGKAWSQEDQDKWEAKIRGAYGSRTAAMRQELDAIPAESEGQALSRVQIENCMVEAPVIRWAQPDDFRDWPAPSRKAEVDKFCEEQLLPILEKLDTHLRHVVGQDFARKGDASCIDVKSINRDLTRQTRLLVELRNIPFEEQRDIMYFICDRLPRFSGGAWDATGNGAYLAEKAAQKYGSTAVEVHFSRSWYQENSPAYIEAFGSNRSVLLPKDEDVVKDHQALAYIDGIIKVPENFRFKGTDGFSRHGDSALASLLAYWVSFQNLSSYGYESASTLTEKNKRHKDDRDALKGNVFSRSNVFGRLKGLW